jgi:hypothetical protein
MVASKCVAIGADGPVDPVGARNVLVTPRREIQENQEFYKYLMYVTDRTVQLPTISQSASSAHAENRGAPRPISAKLLTELFKIF